ncbi:MAG: isoprenylcysteine carboxylmethyltransferase family protein [Pseudomonadota bacterium]
MILRVPPVLQALVCGAISWGTSYLAPFLAFSGWWLLAFAGLFLAIGAIILVLAVRAFVRARTTVNPLSPDDADTLVTNGLYRLSRNPMYLAMACLLVGAAFLIGNLAAFIGPVLFVWVMTELQIKPEERALHSKFGEAFLAYSRRTRRWI